MSYAPHHRYAQAAYSGVMLPPSAEDVEQKLKMTQGALQHRLGTILNEHQVPYTLEVVKAAGDAESIGEFICSRAVELDAALVVMGAHEKGAAVRFFIGSVTSHCVKHCARYVVPFICVLHIWVLQAGGGVSRQRTKRGQGALPRPHGVQPSRVTRRQ